VKDQDWLRDALTKLDAMKGWRAEVAKFVVAFMFGTGLRPGELRLAALADLDTQRWVFKVIHPKRVPGAAGGAEPAVFQDTRGHVPDYLAVREKRLRELGFDPARVTVLVPSELGRHDSEAGFRNLRVDMFKEAGVRGDCRVFRRTHEQILMDRLDAHDYREGSIIEISAKRLRHSMQTAVRHYADLRTARGQKAAQGAWETPVVKVRDRGV